MPGRCQASAARKIAYLFSSLALTFFIVHHLTVQSFGTGMGSTEPPAPTQVFRFENVPGYFLQDDSTTDPAGFDYASENFGLKRRPYPSDTDSSGSLTPWQRFATYLDFLNHHAPAGTSYKLLYLGRHGEGEHNVAEAKYGTKAWDDYWSKLDGDGVLFWNDAHLTDKGKQQALSARDFFQKQFQPQVAMPAPGAYIVSPLYRCLQTANFTFTDCGLPVDGLFRPLIKELVREVMGEHTCDRRSRRSLIADAFPSFMIEGGFSEQDELWRPDHRETHDEHDVRTQHLLDDVWQSFPRYHVLSFTAHSGTIASHLRVLRHRDFRLPTGGLIPLLVRATRLR